MTPIEKLERYIRKRYETNESFENLVASLKEEQKEHIIDIMEADEKDGLYS